MAMTNPLQFIQQVRAEVSKVVWPTRREVMLTTVMVFILAAETVLRFQDLTRRAANRARAPFFIQMMSGLRWSGAIAKTGT